MSSDLVAPPPLRLTIAHLMLWTLGTAIALGLYRPFLATQMPSTTASETLARHLVFQKVITLSLIPFGGASLGALILAIVHRARGGKQFPVQPGHWLLIVYGAAYVAMAVTRLLLTWLGSAAALQWGTALVSLLLVPVHILPILLVRDAPRWTVLFAVELLRRIGIGATAALYAVVFSAMQGGRPNMGILSLVIGLLSLLLVLEITVLAVTLILELIARPQRDYLHWTGCLTQVAIAVVSLTQFVFLRFLR